MQNWGRGLVVHARLVTRRDSVSALRFLTRRNFEAEFFSGGGGIGPSRRGGGKIPRWMYASRRLVMNQ